MEMSFWCVGKESNGLYMMRFVGDVSGEILKIDEKEKKPVKKIKMIEP